MGGILAINGSSTPTNPNASSGFNPIYCLAAVPLGRVALSGQRVVRIKRLHMYGGSGGTIGIYAANADGGDYQSSGGFGSVASGSWDTGWRGLSKLFSGVQPGWEMRLGFTFGPEWLNYGRHAAGGDIYGGGGVEWSGASLSGEFDWAEVPSAPGTPQVTPGPAGKATVVVPAPADNGNDGIEVYHLQWATNAAFTTGVGSSETASNVFNLSLSPGQVYYFRAVCRNATSRLAGTYSPWSGASSAQMLSGGRVRVGGAWREGLVKVRVGGQWRQGIVKVRVGGQWRDAR